MDAEVNAFHAQWDEDHADELAGHPPSDHNYWKGRLANRIIEDIHRDDAWGQFMRGVVRDVMAEEAQEAGS